MSASLVGSEMCIRDSDRTAPTTARPPRGAEQGGSGVGPACPSTPPLGPVSYTHLTLPTICSV
eukprot:11400644-Alexandrium_andersonii.AAC.1